LREIAATSGRSSNNCGQPLRGRSCGGRDHFYGLQEAKPDLVGVALFDRLDKDLKTDTPLYEMMWRRREIENYFCPEEVLVAYSRSGHPDDFLSPVFKNDFSKLSLPLLLRKTDYHLLAKLM